MQHIVAKRLVAGGKPESYVLDDRVRDGPEIGKARPKVTDMAAQNKVCEIEEPIENQDPGEEKMPAPPHRQILGGWERRPGGKAALFKFAVVAPRCAEHAGRVEGMSEDRRETRGRIPIIVAPRREREEGPLEIGGLRPG